MRGFSGKGIKTLKEREKEKERERTWRREFAFKSLAYRNLRKEKFFLSYRGVEGKFSSGRSCSYLELLLQQLMNKRVLDSYNSWVKKVRELSGKELTIEDLEKGLEVRILDK